MSKQNETKIDQTARNIIGCTKIEACTSKTIVPKEKMTFDLFLYTSFSLEKIGFFKFNLVSFDILKNLPSVYFFIFSLSIDILLVLKFV